MARQGKTNESEAGGPDSSMALDDGDIVSVKASDPLNMTIPMTGNFTSPFTAPNHVEATRAFPVPELPELPDYEDEKTVKVRIPDIAAFHAEPVDKLNRTVTGVQPLDTSPKAVLPFQESTPGAPIHFRSPGAVPPTADFTGTLTLSLDEQVRAEIQRITPFKNTAEPSPKPTDLAAPIYEPHYVPIPAPTAMPDVFRAHLAAAPPVASPPRTIGESAVAGVFAIPKEALLAPVDDASTAPVLASKTVQSDPVVLLYLDRASIPRMVRKPVWQKILDSMEDEAIDPEADDPALSTDPLEIQHQTQTYAILKHGTIVGIPAAEATLEAAVAKRGRFAPPIELFEGDLEPIFDDVEFLRALVATLGPLATNDEKLEKALQVAGQVLQASGSTNVAPLARRQRLELQTAYQSGKRSMFFDEIEALVSRSMLEQKKYRLQTILGGEHLCAWFFMAGHDKPELVYVPSDAAPFLPLSRRFLARMIAEIQIPQDDDETHSMVIRCLALSKVVRKRPAR